MTQIRTSVVAERDLTDIWLAIAAENQIAATRVLGAIASKIALLERFPRIGPRRQDIRPSTRLLVEGFYLILYETQPDTDEGEIAVVEIVRVIDGRRDLSGLWVSF